MSKKRISENQLSLFDQLDHTDSRPLPLLAAEKWGFPLSHIITPKDTYIYRMLDWLAGMVDIKYAKQAIKDFRRPGGFLSQCVDGVHSLDEPDKRNRIQKVEYVTDEVLYRATQDMVENPRGKKRDMTRIDAIKDYLAKSGAKIDTYRIDPELQERDAIAGYIRQGKSEKWIADRLTGIQNRKHFTDTLMRLVENPDYREATESVYMGVLHADTQKLRHILHIAPKQNVRDNMSQLALSYVSIAEQVCAIKLEGVKETDPVPYDLAIDIIQIISHRIGVQANDIATSLGINLITGQKLIEAKS